MPDNTAARPEREQEALRRMRGPKDSAATPNEFPLCGPCSVHDHMACKGCGCGYCADLRREDQQPETAAQERACLVCGVYLAGHGRCPVTVTCPHCGAVPGLRCIKGNGHEMNIGSHARRTAEARRV